MHDFFNNDYLKRNHLVNIRFIVRDRNLLKLYEKSVFIVEDNEAMINLYSDLLAFTDWKVIATSKNGLNALDLYQGFSRYPEVVILDITLPGCSGIDVAKGIPNVNPNQQILFVSGQTEKLFDELMFKNYPRLKKPFQISQFLILLTEISDKQREIIQV